MKITIDTKEDSHDEIKKVIKLLQTMIESSGVATSTNLDIFGASEAPSEPVDEPKSESGMFDMFGSKEPASQVITEDSTPEESPISSPESDNEVEEVDSVPEVQLY